MSGNILGVAHTGITVSNLDRACAFFRDVLGATISDRIDASGSVFSRITGVSGASIRIANANLAGHGIELLEYVEPAKKRSANLRPCDPGHMHLALKTDSGINEIAERLRSGGFEPVGSVQEVVEHGGVKAIYTVGFDNIVIELMYVPPARQAAA